MEQRTTKPEYIEPILGILGNHGAMTEDELLSQVFRFMRDRLYPADFVVLPNGEPRWRNQAQHMLDGLIDTGRICKKDGRYWLSENQQP